mgnify:CR=1 FL=1
MGVQTPKNNGNRRSSCPRPPPCPCNSLICGSIFCRSLCSNSQKQWLLTKLGLLIPKICGFDNEISCTLHSKLELSYQIKIVFSLLTCPWFYPCMRFGRISIKAFIFTICFIIVIYTLYLILCKYKVRYLPLVFVGYLHKQNIQVKIVTNFSKIYNTKKCAI